MLYLVGQVGALTVALLGTAIGLHWRHHLVNNFLGLFHVRNSWYFSARLLVTGRVVQIVILFDVEICLTQICLLLRFCLAVLALLHLAFYRLLGIRTLRRHLQSVVFGNERSTVNHAATRLPILLLYIPWITW